MKWTVIILLISALIAGCGDQPDANEIIDKTIAAHGGKNYNNFRMNFNFRGNSFELMKENGKFKYEKTYTDSAGDTLREVINNDGIKMYVNDKLLTISDKEKARIDNQVNSVAYFTLIPEPLNDKAVIKKYLGETEIDGEEYFEIEVTFKQEGGGTDYRDRYIYWINKNNFEIDYFAYYFHVNDGGHRFRKQVNKRKIGGILVSDNINYTSDTINSNIENYGRAYENGNVDEVSKIILTDVEVVKP